LNFKKLDCHIFLDVDGKSVLILAKEFKGSPIIAFMPDQIISYRITIEKFKNSFLFDLSKANITYLD